MKWTINIYKFLHNKNFLIWYFITKYLIWSRNFLCREGMVYLPNQEKIYVMEQNLMSGEWNYIYRLSHFQHYIYVQEQHIAFITVNLY